MAGLTKTKTERILAGNLTQNPKDLAVCGSDYGGAFEINRSGVFHTNDGDSLTAFVTSFGQFGTVASASNTTNSYQTIIDISNSSKPIIVGCVLSKYANSTSCTTTTEFTIDGIVTEIAYSHTSGIRGRTAIGFVNQEGYALGTTTFKSGRGIRFEHSYIGGTEHYGVGANGVMEVNDGAIDDPYDVYVRGWGPLLYAEHSMKIRQKQSAIYSGAPYNQCAVAWRYLYS